MFRIESEKPLPSKCKDRYNGLAYDGCFIYLTIECECRILQLDYCFQYKQCFDTCRIYNKICYDPCDKCFWASSNDCKSMLFKLNECFMEIDCICISNPDVCGGAITGISYNCCNNNLIVSFASGIISIDKLKPKQSTTILRSRCEWIMGVTMICPYIICYCFEDDQRSVRIYDCCGKMIKKIIIPCDIMIESAVFFPCKKNCNPCRLYVLILKHYCYPYILDCVIECDELCNSICPCNYEICNRDCCDKPCCHKDPCADVMESIALMEAAIAHILNAEGEKIQKVLSSTDNICEILEVNKSVSKTMEKAIHLEQLLQSKLSTLEECCDLCDDQDCCASKDKLVDDYDSFLDIFKEE